MKFGIFDHMDRGAAPLGEQYENRLRLIEIYDRTGFHAYHLAEHHATPLGMAPSPSVFLAAVAQRTQRLRFGPLVYTLSLHHPLRVAEEICMLDHMSGGRLELGIGRGISSHELSAYGVDPAAAQPIYVEALAVILQALTASTLNFDGAHFRFRDVPIEMAPVQKPHPPLWYGVSKPEGTAWPAQHKVNIVTNTPADRARTITDAYRAAWAAAGHSPATLPLLGMNRHIVVADSDDAALAIARRAYRRWYESFMKLWIKHGTRPPNAMYPDNFDDLQRVGIGVAGSPDRVRAVLAEHIETSGINYLAVRFAFGDLAFGEAERSVALFVDQVMPALAGGRPDGRLPAAREIA
jgi:alkanesulfonate monooxygenase SsuD/methylene tetrahydromethanopterin reductase-like flavin-dependent oxidoreductase (luciferase family)